MLKKLSLAAVVAMGSISFANATDLGEVVKGVDASGYVRYRLNSTSTSNDLANEYKILLNLSTQAADNIKLNTQFMSGGAVNGKTANNGSDANPPVNTVLAYFTYAKDNLTVKYGKQPIATPLTDGTDQRGTGLLALYNTKIATVAFARFMNSDIMEDGGASATDSKDITAVAAIGNVKNVDLQAWYINAVDTIGHDVFTQAKYSVKNVDLTLQYANAAWNKSLHADVQSVVALGADFKVKNIDLSAGFVKAGNDGGVVNIVDNDTAILDAGEISEDYEYNADQKTAFLKGSMLVAANATVGLDLVRGAGSVSVTEATLRGTYKFNNKLKATAYYAASTGDDVAKRSKSRIEVKYCF